MTDPFRTVANGTTQEEATEPFGCEASEYARYDTGSIARDGYRVLDRAERDPWSGAMERRGLSQPVRPVRRDSY